MTLSERILQQWYRPALTPFTALLLPLAWLFGGVVRCRRYLYQRGWLKTVHFSVPVLVVGNVTVGGTGKTPMVIWLAEKLRDAGYRPGIVTRGVGRRKTQGVLSAQPDSDAALVGDEAVVLARRSGCPVRVSANRVAAVKALLQETRCNIVISDDGLQHYRLGRRFEMALMDSVRARGNGHLLPAGPLREPVTRFAEVDAVLVKGEDFTLKGSTLVGVADSRQRRALSDFSGQRVHAVAGIGHPEQFFAALRAAGITVIPHAFSDHCVFQKTDITFADELPVIMTEKDAVKCHALAGSEHWCFPVSVQAGEKLQAILEKSLW